MERDGSVETHKDGGAGVADSVPATHESGLPEEIPVQPPQQEHHTEGIDTPWR